MRPVPRNVPGEQDFSAISKLDVDELAARCMTWGPYNRDARSNGLVAVVDERPGQCQRIRGDTYCLFFREEKTVSKLEQPIRVCDSTDVIRMLVGYENLVSIQERLLNSLALRRSIDKEEAVRVDDLERGPHEEHRVEPNSPENAGSGLRRIRDKRDIDALR